MFFQLLFIHLFRPFLKYKQATSPLPAHVSPRKFLTHAASMISKLLRLYKRTHGLRQICNIVVYISHAACTVHLLNLPDKNAARDIVHGLKHLEEIGESWLCARRTLGILHLVARRWNIELPDEAEKTFVRAETKFGPFKDHDSSSPKMDHAIAQPMTTRSFPPSSTTPTIEPNPNAALNPVNGASTNGYYPNTAHLANSVPASDNTHLGVNGSLRVQQQKSANFNKPNPQNYLMHQNSQNYFNNNQASQANPSQPTTSPTMLFGHTDTLVPDHEWWLKDSNQIFANWNGVEHEAMLQGNGGFDMGTGNMGYGNTVEPYNMNGNGMNAVGMNGDGMAGLNGNGMARMNRNVNMRYPR